MLVPTPRLQTLLAGPIDLDGRSKRRPPPPQVPATPGLAIVHRATRRRGRVLSATAGAVRVRMDTGGVVELALRPGAFLVDDTVVTLARPPAASRAPQITASGSVADASPIARVARASRIWVEGRHDAELLEKIWGDDLRSVGVVVESLDGMDDLSSAIDDFGPAPHRRLGILLDHLVGGTKETREASRARRDHVLIVGHPFVDVWAAVRPGVIGIDRWPDIPIGTPWKQGVCDALGAESPGVFWRHVLGSVSTWTDLDTTLINAVERMIDFVTVDDDH